MKRATCDLATYLLIHYNIMGRVWGKILGWWEFSEAFFVWVVCRERCFLLLHGDGAILTCYRSEMIRLGM